MGLFKEFYEKMGTWNYFRDELVNEFKRGEGCDVSGLLKAGRMKMAQRWEGKIDLMNVDRNVFPL